MVGVERGGKVRKFFSLLKRYESCSMGDPRATCWRCESFSADDPRATCSKKTILSDVERYSFIKFFKSYVCIMSKNQLKFY